MTPQLRQAIKLLQFSNFEVAAFIEEELERNPLLERDERIDIPPERPALDQRIDDRAISTAEPISTDLLVSGDTLPSDHHAPLDNDHAEQFDDGPYDGGYQDDGGGSDRSDWGMGRGASSAGNPEGLDGVAQLVAHARTLREHLSEQLRLAFTDPTERLIGAHLIALLDGAGRVLVDDAALAHALGSSQELVASVRGRMMRFDPAGIFAVDLKSCLAAQLADRNRLDPAMVALLDNLELLGRRELRRLQAVCEVDAEDLAEMIAEIKALDPKPGASFDITPPLPIVPDVLMRAAPGGDWLLELNPETMPRLLVSEAFHAKVLLRSPKEDRAFLSEKLASANWLVKSLHQRAQTILKVSSEVMRQQEAFLRRGVGHLRPLILRDIAEAVEMHESTVSRVTANKYISTPRGLFELKYFFTAAIAGTAGGESHSAEAVRFRIRGMVAAETLQTILSDDAIVAALRQEGVDIARRTVAKYRDALRIPSSVQRKRDKSLPA